MNGDRAYDATADAGDNVYYPSERWTWVNEFHDGPCIDEPALDRPSLPVVDWSA